MYITKDNDITETTYSTDLLESVIAIYYLQQSGHKMIFSASINDSGGAWITNEKLINWGGKNASFLMLFSFHNICSTACFEYRLVLIEGYLFLIYRPRRIVL